MEWLEDVILACCGRHMAKEVRIVQFVGGSYVKMCRACYVKEYPNYDYDKLEIAS